MPSLFAKHIMINFLKSTFAVDGFYGVTEMSNTTFLDLAIGDAYTTAQKARLASRMQSHPLQVYGAWPRDQKRYPCIVVSRVRDQEVQGFVGDFLGKQEEGGQTIECKASLFSEVLDLYIATVNTDGDTLRDEIYHCLKAMFVENRKELIRRGFIEPMWAEGQDGQIDFNPRGGKTNLQMYTASCKIAFTGMSTTETVVDDGTGPDFVIKSNAINPGEPDNEANFEVIS